MKTEKKARARRWAVHLRLTDAEKSTFKRMIEETHIKHESGCWLWSGEMRGNGYGAAYYSTKPRKRIGAHQLSFLAFGGSITPELSEVRHLCHTPACVNPAHLAAGSMQDNVNDRNAAGRQARGESQGLSKLKDAQVMDIRKQLNDGRSIASLARLFKVSERAISLIKFRKTWKHLP